MEANNCSCRAPKEISKQICEFLKTMFWLAQFGNSCRYDQPNLLLLLVNPQKKKEKQKVNSKKKKKKKIKK